jgi:hypothetical protein
MHVKAARPSLFGLRAGNVVEVRSAEEIIATLDSEGCLENLPFMPEMLACCGKRFKVFKRVDKIIDMINKTGLRRMSSTVLLDDVRCDGRAHGGCQASCQLLWKEDWLRRVSRKSGAPKGVVSTSAGIEVVQLNSTRKRSGQSSEAEGETYRCQATELYDASSYLARWDPRQYASPLWSGNVGLMEFLSFFSIKLFNVAQKCTNGATYPYWPGSTLTKTPTAVLNLQPGDWVYVKTKEEIQQTLDSTNRNRGLWFDHEMLRFCGGRFRVLRTVERLIDEKTGKLQTLKNPCVMLDGVTTKGDFYRFYPQNDYPLWREIWLRRE